MVMQSSHLLEITVVKDAENPDRGDAPSNACSSRMRASRALSAPPLSVSLGMRAREKENPPTYGTLSHYIPPFRIINRDGNRGHGENAVPYIKNRTRFHVTLESHAQDKYKCTYGTSQKLPPSPHLCAVPFSSTRSLKCRSSLNRELN